MDECVDMEDRGTQHGGYIRRLIYGLSEVKIFKVGTPVFVSTRKIVRLAEHELYSSLDGGQQRA